MIDDEKLQELLTRASSLYHDGEYQGAITAWQDALSIDPSSQKAKEGVRMATLLLGDWQPPPPGPEAPKTDAAPADGQESTAGLSSEELEARVDLGVARVKELLAKRQYADALEGARGLLPIDPNSENVKRIVEEAQQAFEAAPFIEEHLTLARELFDQERFSEAETQCEKVFALDQGHPEAQDLLAKIKGRMGQSLEQAASQLGGMTVKLSADEVVALTGPAEHPRPTPDLETTGEAAASQEEVASRTALEAAFNQAGIQEEDKTAGGVSPGEAATGEPTTVGQPEKPAEGPVVVEAKTVRPPTMRLVKRPTPAPAASVATPSPPAAPASTAAPQTGPSTSKQAGGQHKTGPHQSISDTKQPDPKGAPVSPAEDAAAWEADLAQLNLKVGERDLLRGVEGKGGGTAPIDGVDADLMSLLDTDIGGFKETAGGSRPEKSAPAAGAGEGDVDGPPVEEIDAVPIAAPAPVAAKQDTRISELSGDLLEGMLPQKLPSKRARPRSNVAAPRAKKGSSGLKVFFFLVLLLGAGGAAGWWYFIKPQTGMDIAWLSSFLPQLLGGAGSPTQPEPPPSSDLPGVFTGELQGPIPTPLGGGQRPTGQDPQAAPSQAAGMVEGDVLEPPEPAPEEPAKPIPDGVDLSPEQIKGKAEPRLTQAEINRKAAAFKTDGARLLRRGKWREARAKFMAALALDPVNFEIKELLDQAQSKIDEEDRLTAQFDSAKGLYADKDYQNCLWKLYRLPRDKGLGNIDLFIRNAWYNWAVITMRAGDVGGTLERLQEVLTLDPDDSAALDIQKVAEKYRLRAKDRIFYTYTERLKLRDFDER